MLICGELAVNFPKLGLEHMPRLFKWPLVEAGIEANIGMEAGYISPQNHKTMNYNKGEACPSANKRLSVETYSAIEM